MFNVRIYSIFDTLKNTSENDKKCPLENFVYTFLSLSLSALFLLNLQVLRFMCYYVAMHCIGTSNIMQSDDVCSCQKIHTTTLDGLCETNIFT